MHGKFHVFKLHSYFKKGAELIFFLADGRLGNQIFQYVFLKSIQKNNEKIIVSGFDDLKEVFEIEDFISLPKKNKWLRIFLYRIVKPAMVFLANKKIISSIEVDHEIILEKYAREATTFKEKKGYFKFFTFVKSGFFQSEDFFNKKFTDTLKIKEKYLNEADCFLKNIPQNTYNIFVHIRRGDYKDYLVYGKSAQLPINYYENQIMWFLKNKSNCFFIFLSDDPEFIKEKFSHLSNKIISLNNHYGTDLSIMTKCKSAILSPSSFSWWGAYLMTEKDIILSPKYWLGFNSKEEYQKGASLSFSKEVNVSNYGSPKE